MAHHPFGGMGGRNAQTLLVHGTIPPALFDCCPVANHNASSFQRMGWDLRCLDGTAAVFTGTLACPPLVGFWKECFPFL